MIFCMRDTRMSETWDKWAPSPERRKNIRPTNSTCSGSSIKKSMNDTQGKK